jgi:calmodulin
MKILSDYDEKVVRALQIAFDLFDKSNMNEIPATELERIMNSLGQSPSFEDLERLVFKIDIKSTGLLQFNDFMMHVVPYLREGYKAACELSLQKLRLIFDKMDVNGDGVLQPYEIKHLLKLTSEQISQSEIDSVVQFLDIDDDGDISWNEFSYINSIVKNDEEMEDLPLDLRSALRKVYEISTSCIL